MSALLALLLLGGNQASTNPEALLRDGKYREAAAACVRLLTDTPDDPQLLKCTGEALLGLRQPRQAIPYFRRELSLDPNDASGAQSLATALVIVNEFDEANGLLSRSTSSEPGNSRNWYLRGKLMYQDGYYAAAYEYLERAVELSPSSALAVSDRDAAETMAAICLLEIGRSADAEKALKPLVSGPGPKNLDALLSYARLLYESGRYAESLAATDTALQQSPNNASAHFWRARIFLHQNEIPKALAEAETARALAPNSPAPHNLLIQIYSREHRPQEAAGEATWLRQRTEETTSK